MKLANVKGRATVVIEDEIADVENVSGGRFGPNLAAIYDEWPTFRDFAATVTTTTGVLDLNDLRCPVPTPRQVFAIGLNYRTHAEEVGMTLPDVPATFTKYPACLAGPFDDVKVHGPTIDWEVELVAVIGARAESVPESDGWAYIAGLTVGQDITDRTLQNDAGRQFSLGKSRTGYGPMGPWVVSLDEVSDPDDLALGCSVDGEIVQDGRTNDLVFSVPRLVAELSSVLPLLPGDVIFTGTPSGVGMGRTPQRFLQPGNVLQTWVEGIGTMRNVFV
jgi:2,4-didehydro-3-deoxy-L-rhamnonate hydrolase